MDCDLGYVSQISSYLPELLLVVVFIIAIESNLGQCPSPHPPLDLAPDRPGCLAELWLSELSSYLFCDSPNGRVLQSGVSVSGSTLGKVQKYAAMIFCSAIIWRDEKSRHLRQHWAISKFAIPMLSPLRQDGCEF